MISECLCKPMDMEPRHFYPDAKIVKSRGSLRMPIFHLQIDFFFKVSSLLANHNSFREVRGIK